MEVMDRRNSYKGHTAFMQAMKDNNVSHDNCKTAYDVFKMDITMPA